MLPIFDYRVQNSHLQTDLLAQDIRYALEVLGTITDEETILIVNIFTRFCIEK